jgi:glycosyltransferase involved in cell wall biosynthesis
LVLIGDMASQPDYVQFVHAEAIRLGVADRVDLLGKVSEPDLIVAFSDAGSFVSMSEHEGFGVPLVEAMAAGVPVFAYGAAAVPETMGGAGVLLDSKDPDVVASTVQAVRTDGALRARLVARQLERVRRIESFDTEAVLRRVLATAGGRPPVSIQVQGPFETSYSLARVNRRLAEALASGPHDVSIYPTEGPGDYLPDPEDVARHPTAAGLYARAAAVPYPDVVIRQMWPPRLADSPGGVTCEYFGWEESVVPPGIVRDFNRHLDGVGVFSEFVKVALRDSGVDVPVAVVGVGVDPPDPDARCDAPELDGLREFRFLHISSAFPRKGVDVLLEAYFGQFSGADDVSLILKTFPNPHNEVGAHLARLRADHPDPPDVRWIDRDLDDGSLQGLYAVAGCYVHPARGEGFGLPVAEAMAAGVPVIAPASSGLAEFVSEDTAITVPFTMEPADTHLATPGSVWAEPDREAVGTAMRKLFVDPGSPEVQQRVDLARQLIADRFRWELVADRWQSFIDELEQTAPSPSVAMVSTWNSRCGIADYTRCIVEGAGDSIRFEIFADRDVEIIDADSETEVVRDWNSRWVPSLDDLHADLELAEPEVVHFQFNFAFFELAHLAALIRRQLSSRTVVVTLHRTSEAVIEGSLVGLHDIASTLQSVDRIIVHQQSDVDRLAGMGIAENVTLIHMGTPAPPVVDRTAVRDALGIDDRPVIGAFGFLLPHKGTLELVAVVDSLRAEMPGVHLLAMCARHPDTISTTYEAEVRSEIERRGLSDHVTLITDFLDDEVVRTMLSAADVIALPYGPTEESASSALRFVLPVGRPIVATDLPIFADARDALALVEPGRIDELTTAVRRVLTDPAHNEDLARRAAACARRYRWSLAVAQHREVYTAAIALRRRDGG